jgi:3-ketosteroid 9alpha-monooxygenase subunit A
MMAKAVDYGLGPHTFPRGWFIVAESSELKKRGTMAVRFFGKDLALYRGDSGRPVMLDAYCPHMKTHITASESASLVKEDKQIEGDSIRCPYHGWRFRPDGQCDDIPYQDGPCPRSAVLNSYHVEEVMGCIMMWHDEEGRPPDYPAPKLAEWDDPQWVPWQLYHLGEMEIHPQEILDNMADAQHFGPTHGAPCEFFEDEFLDHLYIQRQGGVHAGYGKLLLTITWYTGPGILLSKQSFGEVRMYELIASTPIDDGKVKVWHAALSPAAGATPTEEDYEMARQLQAGALEAFSSDFSVWKHKEPAIRVLQQRSDGPFNKGRQWYKQFYDLAEKAPEYHKKRNGLHHVLNLSKPPEALYEFEGDLFEQLTAA